MKILLATYWPIPHLGGVWNYMVQLRKKLELLGHQVDMLGYDEDNYSVYIVNENRKIARERLIPLLEAKLNSSAHPEIHANILVKYTEFQRYIYELSASYLGLNKYDVIHTQDVLAAASIARIKPRNIALVNTIHGSVAHEIHHQLSAIHKSDNSFMAKAYFDELEKIGASSGDENIVANQWLKNVLINEFQVPSDGINVLHYGFDSEDFIKKTNLKSNIEKPKNKKVILYAGRLIQLKGVQNLISALSRIKKEQNDWVCWIVGEGYYMSELQMQVQSLGLQEDVLFFGRRDDIPYLLTLADIFVYPSLLENQPLSVIEAQIAGKAIIVSDSGGLPEIVEDGVTGLVYPANSTNELAKRIVSLLNDENYVKLLGSNAKKWGMTHWSLDQGVKNLISIYESAISKRKRIKRNETYYPLLPKTVPLQLIVEPDILRTIAYKVPKNYSLPNPTSVGTLKKLYIETYSIPHHATYNRSNLKTNSEPIDETYFVPYMETSQSVYEPYNVTNINPNRKFYNESDNETYSEFQSESYRETHFDELEITILNSTKLPINEKENKKFNYLLNKVCKYKKL